MQIFGFLLLIISFVLLFLQLFAYFNLEQSDRSSQGISASVHWLLREEIYNSQGKKACRLAKIIWLFSLPLIVVWLVMKFG